MNTPQSWRMPLSLFIITAICFGFFNAYLPVTDPVESNYVLTAKDMVLHNSWLSPMIYGHVWFDKPPLTYWALMAVYKLLGISDFTSRLPNTLIAAGNVSFMYVMVRRILQDREVALIASVTLGTTLLFWYISHAIITDGFLFFFTIGIFGYGYLGLTRRSHRYMVITYAFAGLAVLTKGPIGLILPGFIFILFIICRALLQHAANTSDSGKLMTVLFSPPGIILFLAVSCPWYIAMYHEYGMDFINGFLGLHNVDRALISEHPKYNVWYYYILLMPTALLPWTPALLHGLKDIKWREPLNLLGAVWFIVTIAFYSLVATKYLTYTFIAIIPCIIWSARHIHALYATQRIQSVKRYVIIPAYIFMAVFLIGTVYDESLSPFPLLTAALLSLAALPRLWHYTVVTARRSSARAFTGIGIILCLMFCAVTVTVPPVLMKQSGLQYVPAVENHKGHVYIYGTYYTSIVYYTDELPVSVFISSTDDPRWTQGKALMPTVGKEEFLERIVRDPSALVIVPDKYRQDYEESIAGIATRQIGSTDGAAIYEGRSAISF